MLVDLADLLCVDASDNPHQLPTEYWCYYPDMILDLVISVTMTHQLLKSQGSQCLLEYPAEQGVNGVVVRRRSYSLGSVHHPHLPSIYKHKQNALEALGKEIQDPETQYSDLTLNIVVMLLRVEVGSRQVVIMLTTNKYHCRFSSRHSARGQFTLKLQRPS